MRTICGNAKSRTGDDLTNEFILLLLLLLLLFLFEKAGSRTLHDTHLHLHLPAWSPTLDTTRSVIFRASVQPFPTTVICSAIPEGFNGMPRHGEYPEYELQSLWLLYQRVLRIRRGRRLIRVFPNGRQRRLTQSPSFVSAASTHPSTTSSTSDDSTNCPSCPNFSSHPHLTSNPTSSSLFFAPRHS
jgi:hypothetical protein